VGATAPAGYRIRDAVEADLTHLPAVERSAAALLLAVDNGYRGADDTLPLAVLDLCRAAGTLWIAAAPDDAPVGFLAATEIDTSLFVLEMSVAREHQRRGLGRALLEKAIDHARWAYLPAVSLTTDRKLAWNRPFYASLGFVTLDSERVSPGLRARREAEIAAGHDPARRCIMAKLL
jgi:GNAT superfamily N-acetyltransferase